MSSETRPEASATPAIHPQAVEGLKKLKATESLWQKRLDEARARGETKIKYAQAARDRTLADAQRAAEEMRAQRIRDARNQAETEARKILDQAKASVGPLGALSGKEIDQRMEEVLAAIFGDLRTPPAGKGSATAAGRSTASGSNASTSRAASAVPAR